MVEKKNETERLEGDFRESSIDATNSISGGERG